MFKKHLLILGIGLFLISCGGSKNTTSKRVSEVPRTEKSRPTTTHKTVNSSDTHLENGVNPVPKAGVNGYIDFYAPIAQEEMRRYGIPASITLAQGILESGAGSGELVRKANNHFGIKCHSWEGERVYHDDDEKGECFRKYELAQTSYRDHSLFLSRRKRYAALFELAKDDYKGWAKGLHNAGYATDKKYPDKLISLIERFELYRYDGEVLGKPIENYDKITNDIKKTTVARHVVQKGENLYRISIKYKRSIDELILWNKLKGNEIYEGQVLNVSAPK